MILFDLFGLVVKDIMKRKFSSFLTFFAISLGIFAIFMIMILSVSFEDSIKSQFEDFGSSRLYISEVNSNYGQSSTSKGLSDSLVNQLEAKPYVEKVYPYVIQAGSIEYSNEFKTKTLYGIELSEEYFKDFNLDLSSGRFAKSSEKYSILVGPTFAQDFFSKELSVGSNIYIKGTKFKVVGILESIGNPQDDNNIYINIDTLRELFDLGDKVSMLDTKIVETYDMELAQENIQIFLDNRLGEDKAEVTSPTQILDQLNSILAIVQSTLGGIAFVALLVGALGIINTMYVIVTEKVKEIGIMKSIGATNETILFLFSFQAGLFGFLGALLGILFGVLGAKAFESVAQTSGFAFLEVNFEPTLFIYLLLFGFLVGVFAGFVPARKASKLNIVEALRK